MIRKQGRRLSDTMMFQHKMERDAVLRFGLHDRPTMLGVT